MSNYNYQMPPQMPPQPGNPPQRPVILNPPRQTKNKFLTFVLACIPGAGQMYHGLMKRGISLMLLFWGIIGVSVVTYLGVLNILLPIVWFYSFFDAVNRMNTPIDELKTIKDGYLFFDGRSQAFAGRMEGNSTFRRLFQERHLIIGWLLIAVAAWILINNLFGGWLGYSFWAPFIGESAYYALRDFVRTIPALVVPVVCVVIGIKLIVGERNRRPVYDEYTIPRESGGKTTFRGGPEKPSADQSAEQAEV